MDQILIRRELKKPNDFIPRPQEKGEIQIVWKEKELGAILFAPGPLQEGRCRFRYPPTLLILTPKQTRN